MDCANCRQTMLEHTCDGFYAKRVTIDVCHSCCAIWFDNQELLQMTPAATIQLLAELADKQTGARQPLVPRLSCPRCQRRLVETHDQQHNVKFWYHRCPDGHGRFVTYFQFLRAKNVVRPLADAEIEELRRHVRQINCANCGAPVDVEKGGICGFCQSPLAILDADQLKKIAADVKKGQEKAAAGIDPTLPLALAMERTRTERAFAELAAEDQSTVDIFGLLHDTRDPVLSALKGLSRLLR